MANLPGDAESIRSSDQLGIEPPIEEEIDLPPWFDIEWTQDNRFAMANELIKKNEQSWRTSHHEYERSNLVQEALYILIAIDNKSEAKREWIRSTSQF